MENKKGILKLVGIILIFVLIVGLIIGLIKRNKDDENVIKVGLIVPLTGDQAVWGNDVKKSVELYTEEFNNAGGINGKKIQLVIYDDKGDPTESVNAYNKLYSSDKVVSIIGPVSSGCCFSVAEVSAKDGMPCITGTATHPDVTKYGDNFFRAGFEDPFQGSAITKFAKNELEAKSCAIIYDNSNSYSSGLKDSITKEANNIGLNIVATEAYGADDVDFNSQLTNIIAKKTDVLFVPDYYNNVYLVCKQARELGFKGTFVGADATDGVLDIEGIDKTVLEGLYFSSHYATDDTGSMVVEYIRKYKEKYNAVPNGIAALGYDAAVIMYDALSRVANEGSVKLGANEESYKAVVQALKDTDLECVTGHVTFDESNNPIKVCKMMKIENGVSHFYMDY